MAKRGRPTKLTPELKKKAWEYVREWEEKAKRLPEVIPTIAGLSLHLGIVKNDIYEYAKKDEEFLNLVERVNQIQEKILITGSITHKLNPKIAALVLAKHGYHYKEEVSGELTIKKPLIELSDEEDN